MRARGLGRRFMIAAGTAAMLGALALPAGATAATANVSGSTFTFTAEQGESNDVMVETDGSVFRVSDGSAPVTAGAGCSQRSVHRVSCANAGVTLVHVLARDQADTVQTLIGTTDATLNGGSGGDALTSDGGDDTLIAGPGGTGFSSENLTAGAGEDTLQGPTTSSGSSFLSGGPGDDELLGGPGGENLFGDSGADLLQGGEGFDLTSWSGAAAVNVTVGSGANDGEAGEGDDVRSDVEEVFGTFFDDVIIGTAGQQQFFGQGGKDTLEGRGGGDFLDGGDGADTIEGEAGPDDLQGGPRADDFSGGTENDTVFFGDHDAKVKVAIDNVANDGSGGGIEGDNVRADIEEVEGGPNDDLLIGNGQGNRLVGAGGEDDVRGEAGDDEVFGDSTFQSGALGDDQLGGGPGDDQLFGGGGADDLQGATGFDFADYSRHAGSTALTITIDNVANDGAAGEGDNVMDTVEGVVGANGSDTITGNSVANTLFGGAGADNILGGGGRDLLDGETPNSCCSLDPDAISGGAGVDTVSYTSHGFVSVTVDIDGVADDGGFGGTEGDNVDTTVENLIGGEGADSLTGSNAANAIAGRNGFDSLFGGGGPDTLTGGSGGDTHEGQAGKDEINSRGDNNIDTDNCGTEADVAIADAFDTVNADCETQIP
jgi:Ca2+-binding RTX toxin-like protein